MFCLHYVVLSVVACGCPGGMRCIARKIQQAVLSSRLSISSQMNWGWLALAIALRVSSSFCQSYVTHEKLELSLILSPGNVKQVLTVCEGQRLADATADFLLALGMHGDNFIEEKNEYDGIIGQLCWSMSSQEERGRCHRTVGEPSRFLSEESKYTTVHFGNGGPGSTSVPIYLREGYSAEQLSHCLCEKVGCEEGVLSAVTDYLRAVMSKL